MAHLPGGRAAEVEGLEVGPLRSNAYLLGCPRTGKGIVIDPGDEAERLRRRIDDRKLDVEAIVLTHAHLDHAGAAAALAAALRAQVAVHPADAGLYAQLPDQLRMFGLPPGRPPPPPDRLIEDGDEVRAGDIVLRVIHTPGHTLGSICLLDGDRLYSGDTLFRGGIGRTDLGGTSPAELIAAIRERLYPLGDEVRVFPGHGQPTTIGHERRTNPFLTGAW